MALWQQIVNCDTCGLFIIDAFRDLDVCYDLLLQ